MKIRAFLRQFAPDFCWMTAGQLLIMAEQVDEDVDYACLATTLSEMVKKGEMIARPDPHPTRTTSGRIPHQYLMVRPC